MKRIVIATRNPKKLGEIREILKDSGIEFVGVHELPEEVPEVEEDRPDFEGNAIKKAVEVARNCGHLTLADDSGLEVDALDGAPGVYSARFSGDDATPQKNNDLLLEKMVEVADEKRTARFHCVVALADENGVLETFHGTCEGRITRAPRGTQGFGYDPLFLLPEKGKTFAEIPSEEKNRLSHRAHAFEKVAGYLNRIL